MTAVDITTVHLGAVFSRVSEGMRPFLLVGMRIVKRHVFIAYPFLSSAWVDWARKLASAHNYDEVCDAFPRFISKAPRLGLHPIPLICVIVDWLESAHVLGSEPP